MDLGGQESIGRLDIVVFMIEVSCLLSRGEVVN
jgi:hypothetical protein